MGLIGALLGQRAARGGDKRRPGDPHHADQRDEQPTREPEIVRGGQHVGLLHDGRDQLAVARAALEPEGLRLLLELPLQRIEYRQALDEARSRLRLASPASVGWSAAAATPASDCAVRQRASA